MPQIKPSNPIIDWGNPITKGLVHCFEVDSLYNNSDRVSGKPAVLTATGTAPTLETRKAGNTIRFSGSNGGGIIKIDTVESQRSLVRATYMFYATKLNAGGGGYGNILRIHDGTTASGVVFGTDDPSNNESGWGMIFVQRHTTTSGNWSMPYPTPALVPHLYIITYDNSSTSNDPVMYLDGVQQSLIERATPAGTPDYKDAKIYIGNLDQTGNVQTRTWGGDIYTTRIWNRILTPTEIKLLSSDPWCIYQKPRFNIINSISSAVTGLRGLISFGMIPFGVAGATVKSRSITIDHTKVGSSTHTDFPVLIAGTYAYLATTANGGDVENANGYDIQFFSDSGLTTPLAFQRVSWSATTGESQFRVKISSLSHSSDTVIYMSYGDASVTTDQQDVANTWNGDFEYVGNLEGNSNDSSTNGYNGTDTSITYGTSYGKYGQGANLATSGNRISLGDQTNLHSTAITYTIWYKPSSFPNAYNCIMGSEASINVQYNTFYVKSSGKLAAYLYGVTSFDESGSTTLSTGTWYMLTLTYDSTNGMKAYVNTTVDKSNVANGNLDMGGVAMIGTQNNYETSRDIRGDIDMPRFMSVAVSGDWVTAQYNNENSPSTFYTVSNEL